MNILGFNYEIVKSLHGFFIFFPDNNYVSTVLYIERKYKITNWNKFLCNLRFHDFYYTNKTILPEFTNRKDARRLAMLLSTNFLIDVQ